MTGSIISMPSLIYLKKKIVYWLSINNLIHTFFISFIIIHRQATHQKEYSLFNDSHLIIITMSLPRISASIQGIVEDIIVSSMSGGIM